MGQIICNLLVQLSPQDFKKFGHFWIVISFSNIYIYIYIGLPWRLSGKECACNAGDLSSFPRLGRPPGVGNVKPIPVFLPGKSHGQRSLADYSP